MRRYIVIICILIIIIFTFNYLLIYDIEAVLYEVMSQRIKIIEATAYGETSYEEAESQLVNITQNPLLNSDLELLKDLNEFPTEIDRVKYFEIGEIDNLCVIGSSITFTSEVLWTMEGLSDTYLEKSSYFFEMKKKKNKYILLDYYPIQ